MATDSVERNNPPPAVGEATVEVALIVCLFFLLAGSLPPDVNEAHYLGKAKHYWNPQWCEGDFFLESADAHVVFYWTFGWLTRLMPLASVAWVGRLLTWFLLAWSWRRLSVAVVPGRLVAVLTAGLFTLLLRTCHLAGEWVIGGVEAKGFAFALVFLGLEALVRGRWRLVWLLFGAASAFHVLVGGWSVVAGLAAWSLSAERPRVTDMLPALAGGFALSLLGLAPALTLNTGVDPSLAEEARQIYVHERLAHHLLLHRIVAQPLVLDFEYAGLGTTVIATTHLYLVRHTLLVAAWLAAVRMMASTEAARRLQRFTLASIGVAMVGVIIDQTTLYAPDVAARVLRYYWFRLSDVAVPMAAALMIAQGIEHWRRTCPNRVGWAVIVATLAVTSNAADIYLRHRHDRAPAAIRQATPKELDGPATRSRLVGWERTCAWISNNTPADALFLTPRNQQTFKWYANRGEVVCWKDIPQDAAGIVEWKHRIETVFPPHLAAVGLVGHGEDEIVRLAEEYGFQYVILDGHRSARGLSFSQVFPARRGVESIFRVYRVPVNATK